MTLIRLNTGKTSASDEALTHVLSSAPHNTAPIIIMIHGYKYDPAHADKNPHSLIFSTRHPHSWPLGLGVSETSATLGISFGWRARGKVREVFGAAGRAGHHLAQLLAALQRHAPQRQVHIIAHSMGAEVATSALAQAPAHSVCRVILLAAATFQSHAQSALNSPAGRTTELIHVTGHQNAVFDTLFEWCVPAPQAGDRAMRHTLSAPNLLNLRLDCARTRTALAGLHLTIARPRHRICHWSGYTTPGALAAYAQMIHSPGVLSFRRLRQALPEGEPRALPALGKPSHAWLTGHKAAEHPRYEPAH